NLPIYSKEQVNLIKCATKGQRNSKEWYMYRKGRISASIAHRVLTRCCTIEKANCKQNVDCSKLVNAIVGVCLGNHVSKLSGIPSLDYSITLETDAAIEYFNSPKVRHDALVVEEYGLFIHPENTFICATSGRLVECKCCGKGLLEIKCPITSADMHPLSASLP